MARPDDTRRGAAGTGPGGPWPWRWRRRRRRRRRITGCLLWLVTLLIVLLVLSLLFGGFRRGSRVGDGEAHAVRSALVQGGARAAPPAQYSRDRGAADR